MSTTQYRLFSIAPWLRTTGLKSDARITSYVA